jgi:hypothetical protein
MMSSSDGRRAAGKAAVAAEPGISTTAVTETRHRAGDASEAASAEVGNLAPVSSDSGSYGSDGPQAGRLDGSNSGPDDPWFGVAGQPVVESDWLTGGNGAGGEAAGARAGGPDRSAMADPEITRVDWFLPGGRAALLPDSMTVFAEEDKDEAETGQSRRQQHAPAAAAGAPPWAAEPAGSAEGAPPPWENGPWPGPGGARPSRPAAAPPGWASRPAARQDEPGPWTPRTVLVTGLLPLVVPGLVVGLLGLRRSSPGEPGRRASVLALAASLAWAVVIVVLVVVVAGGSGSSAGCSYPAAVRQAYGTAMADLSGNASAATQATDLGIAASRANSAAAAAGDVGVRSALFALAGDLQQARADVIAGKRPAVPPALRQRLSADGAALKASCPA